MPPRRPPPNTAKPAAAPSRSTSWTTIPAGKIEVAERAARQIGKLDPPDAARIRVYLRDRLARLDDPRRAGAPLHGSGPGRYWRYRVGDDRIPCELREAELPVLAIGVGHRRSIYRRG